MKITKEEKQKIVLENTPLIKKIVSKIFFKLPKDCGIDFDELINVGVIGLIKAIDKYNKEKAKFSTYAYIKIRGEILDYLRSLHVVPRSMRDKIKKEKEENPNKAIPLSNLAIMISMEKAIGDDSGTKLIDTFISQDRGPEEEAINSEMREILTDAMLKLNEKERLILEMLYFGEKNPKEISEILNISVSRISQLKSSALKKIKKILS